MRTAGLDSLRFWSKFVKSAKKKYMEWNCTVIEPNYLQICIGFGWRSMAEIVLIKKKKMMKITYQMKKEIHHSELHFIQLSKANKESCSPRASTWKKQARLLTNSFEKWSNWKNWFLFFRASSQMSLFNIRKTKKKMPKTIVITQFLRK